MRISVRPLGRLVALAAFVVSGFGAQAQSAQSVSALSFKERLRQQYLTNDTAQAIINLYSKRQGGGAGWIASGVLAGTGLALRGDREVASGPGYTVVDEGPRIGDVVLVTSPILIYGAAKIIRYSNGHLQKVLANYAAGQPLPHNLRRKLKPRFFEPHRQMYQPQPAPATPTGR